MEKGFRSRSNSPGQQDRQALPLQPSRFASNLLSPDDGYDYGDSGPSPEGSASKEKEDAKEQNVIDSSHYAHNRTPAGPEAFSEFDEPSEATRKIFERPGGGTRAKRPDQPNCIDQPPIHVNGQPSSPVATGPVLPKSRWRRRRSRSPSVALNTSDESRFRHVMLQWEREEGDIDGTQRLILRSKLADAHAKIESPNHVTWQHSEFDHMRLENFQDIVNEWKSHGLQDSEAGLTRRVLKRVRTEAQRPFAGGSFLTPTAFRYDILDDSRYSADKCCIFLSFPYFAIAKPQARKSFGKGDPRHPMRTLLQSYYRLNDTSEKDKEQCIRMLDGETLKSCINAPEAEVAQLSCGVNGEVIHVPQMWALVLGSNKMITTSPISDVALQGSSIKILDDAPPPVTPSCVFVRISFLNLRGALEELTYPMELCASWFGLMRRQQHIRDTLRKGSDPREYRFYIGKQVIQDRTWASVQRSAQCAVLKVWMKTPKPPKPKGPIPKLSVQGADSDSDTGSKVLEGTGEESELDEDPSPETAAKFDSLDNVPIVSAFLAWRILDEFGEQDDSSPETKTMDFLNAIYRALPATCERDVVKPSDSTLRPAEHEVDVSKEARPKILIVGRTLLQFDEFIGGIVARANRQLPSTEQKLREECDKLLNFFIPRDHDRQLIPIQLYWGALYELVSLHKPLVQLLEKVKEINVWAETIHLGVHCRRMVRTSEGNGLEEDAISESAILLASMVNALGAIFNMLVQSVRDARLGRKGGQGTLHSSSSCVSYGDEACTLLRKARDELITEATSALPGEHIGPVLTPETILVMVMERLGRGVFGSGSVDIVAIYEECLEHLALTVKSRPSRRLLQTINTFEEEVKIVIDVLLQQKRVLSALQDYLNPGSFKRPTIVRKMRFEFEEKGIERIRTSIREQLRYCAELRTRAKVLAVQNVHLVETLQDDSGRAILVFTFISVFFLPLSFVASFFGMNVVGITGTASTVRHFWVIALPITAGIMTIGGLVVFYGESIWFALVNLPHTCQVLLIKGKGKRKTH